MKAYIEGEVVEVFPKEGVAVRCWGSFIQGIFGIGGETHGELKMVVSKPETKLTDDLINESCKDKIIVGGSIVIPHLRRAVAFLDELEQDEANAPAEQG